MKFYFIIIYNEYYLDIYFIGMTLKILCDRFYNGKDFFLLSDDLNANIVTDSKEADGLMIVLFICFMDHYSNIFVCLSKTQKRSSSVCTPSSKPFVTLHNF